MKKILTIILLVLALIGLYFWLSQKKAPIRNETPIVAEFKDSQTGNIMIVSFYNTVRKAVLNGSGYTNLEFDQSISASGARYVNDKEGLVLWNKGDEVTLYRGEKILFNGIDTAAVVEESPNEILGEIAMGQTGVINGISITLDKVTEDSRCATGVNCFWAGRLTALIALKSNSGKASQSISTDKPIVFDGLKISIESVLPKPIAGTPIIPGSYRITFRVEK